MRFMCILNIPSATLVYWSCSSHMRGASKRKPKENCSQISPLQTIVYKFHLKCLPVKPPFKPELANKPTIYILKIDM